MYRMWLYYNGDRDRFITKKKSRTNSKKNLKITAEAEPWSITLYFDPNEHAENSLKAFNEFCDTFLLRYDALYTDPTKVSIDAAITRWKYGNITEANPEP